MKVFNAAAALAVCLVLTGPSFGQTPIDPTMPINPGQSQRRGGHGRMRQMVQQLGLTADQISQIKEIRKSGVKGKERRQALLAILTPEQKAKFRAIHGHGRRGGRHRRGEQGLPPGSGAPQTTSP